MARDIRQIRIDSVLGGISNYANFGTDDQFKDGYGFDLDASLSTDSAKSSGYLMATSLSELEGTSGENILWFKDEPKIGLVYVYGSSGTIATTTIYNPSFTNVTSLAGSSGNGMEYYDNYMYFARNTSVARFGPLNGSPSMDTDYWGTTLSKTALQNTTYPTPGAVYDLPNHVMYRHTNGKLYFCDVVGNQGVLHCISTKKTTVEGDTDDGSTYNAIDFPNGLYPTALCSLDNNIIVGLFEGTRTILRGNKPAKIAIWDTTNPDNYLLITNDEFPEDTITAIKNVNGVIYIFSTDSYNGGLRITRYLGGKSFEQVAFLEDCGAVRAGAVDSILNRVFFATRNSTHNSDVIYSIGSKKSNISSALYPLYFLNHTSCMAIYKLFFFAEYPNIQTPSVSTGSRFNFNFQSRKYSIGQPHKVTKITLNLTNAISSTTTLTPKLQFDDTSTTTTLTSITKTNYSNTKRIVLKPENAVGQNNFYLQLDAITTEDRIYSLFGIALPITIEYELLDD